MKRLSTAERYMVEWLWIQTGDIWNCFNESKQNTRSKQGSIISTNSGLACWFNYIENTVSDKRNMVQLWPNQSLCFHFNQTVHTLPLHVNSYTKLLIIPLPLYPRRFHSPKAVVWEAYCDLEHITINMRKGSLSVNLPKDRDHYLSEMLANQPSITLCLHPKLETWVSTFWKIWCHKYHTL